MSPSLAGHYSRGRPPPRGLTHPTPTRTVAPLNTNHAFHRDMPRVLYSDHDYADIELERELFAQAGVELFAAQCRTEQDVAAAATGCVGILSQYAPVGEM